MQPQDKPRDFIARSGTVMTVFAWLILLFILLSVFDFFISQHYNPNQNIVTTVNGSEKEVVLQRNRYGHYVTAGTINSREVTFLLDTGATDIAIPQSLAEKIGLIRGPAITVKTANGNTRAYRTRLDSVAIGDIVLYDLRATILPSISGEEVLLGMNFLKNFEITQKGRTLSIKQ